MLSNRHLPRRMALIVPALRAKHHLLSIPTPSFSHRTWDWILSDRPWGFTYCANHKGDGHCSRLHWSCFLGFFILTGSNHRLFPLFNSQKEEIFWFFGFCFCFFHWGLNPYPILPWLFKWSYLPRSMVVSWRQHSACLKAAFCLSEGHSVPAILAAYSSESPTCHQPDNPWS